MFLQTGQQIALLRNSKGLTQQELAEKLFVSRELVSKWETGTRRPPYKTVIEMAKIFSASPDKIMNTDEEILSEISDCFPDNFNISQEDLSDLINCFLATISKAERYIFIARYYHNKSSGETASCLGIKEKEL